MAQPVRVIAAKPDHESSMPRAYMVEREPTADSWPFTYIYVPWPVLPFRPVNKTNKQSKQINTILREIKPPFLRSVIVSSPLRTDEAV